MAKKIIPRDFDNWVKEKWGASKLPRGGVVPFHSSYAYKTGDWSAFKAVIDKDKCISCMNCFYYCPDAAISMDENLKAECDRLYCKGCGICAKHCPAKAITMKRLTR
ncbi:MAG: 4Fe-4S binding protein [Candidatus Heimdallarchaeaceae archaeon]